MIKLLTSVLGGGTILYVLYRYVQPQRVEFFSSAAMVINKVSNFGHKWIWGFGKSAAHPNPTFLGWENPSSVTWNISYNDAPIKILPRDQKPKERN